MTDWLLPALVFTTLMGVFGIFSKLALRHTDWTQLLVWQALAYLVGVGVIMLVKGDGFSIDAGTPAAIAAGTCGIIAMFGLYIALDNGKASSVIPVTSAYPVITVVLAGLVLGEVISLFQAVGVALVFGGVVLLTFS